MSLVGRKKEESPLLNTPWRHGGPCMSWQGDVGPGEILHKGEKHDRLRGGAPLVLMSTIYEEMIGHPRILR